MTDHLADLKLYIAEARQLDNKNIKYVEKNVKGQLNRVTAELKGSSSAYATKLAQSYRNVERMLKEVEEERSNQNSLIKQVEEQYFDPADEVVTRVLESIQYAITFSKVTHKPASSREKVNSEAILKELSEKMPELVAVLAMLTKKHTTATPVPAKTTPSRLSVKHHDELKTPRPQHKTDEAINEDSQNDEWIRQYTEIAKEKLRDFDELLNDMKFAAVSV